MTRKGVNIQDLPDKVLERIFSFVTHDAITLREVCKRFKKIFENSSGLMKNWCFDISKAVEEGAVTVDAGYQALSFNEIDHSQFQLISNIKHKNSIRSVHITTCEHDIKACAVLIQNMLYGFTLLKNISFYNTDDDFDLLEFNDIEFVAPEQSKLESLSVTYDGGKTNIFKMFSKIPSIKKLFVNPFRDTLRLPDVEWKLEELSLTGFHLKLHKKTFLKFLESQKSSLKVLRLNDAPEYTNYIMKNLPNLEKLMIGINGKEIINSKVLVHNDKLRSLSIYEADIVEKDDFDSDSDEDDHNNVGEAILSHYKNVKCLHIYAIDYISIKIVNNLELSYLTHLIMQSCSTNLLSKAKMSNLMFLAASTSNLGDFDESAEVLAENLMNVEALTIYDWDIDEFPDILEKFPKLKHLNLGSGDFMKYECYSIAHVVNDIAPVGSKLAIIGIEKECLDDRHVTYKQLLSEINNKRLVVRLYNGYGAMNFDYWDSNDYGFYHEPS